MLIMEGGGGDTVNKNHQNVINFSVAGPVRLLSFVFFGAVDPDPHSFLKFSFWIRKKNKKIKKNTRNLVKIVILLTSSIVYDCGTV